MRIIRKSPSISQCCTQMKGQFGDNWLTTGPIKHGVLPHQSWGEAKEVLYVRCLGQGALWEDMLLAAERDGLDKTPNYHSVAGRSLWDKGPESSPKHPPGRLGAGKG